MYSPRKPPLSLLAVIRCLPHGLFQFSVHSFHLPFPFQQFTQIEAIKIGHLH